MDSDKKPTQDDEREERKKEKKSEEEIDEEIEQTFPASDPPSYSMPGNDKTEEKKEKDQTGKN